MRPAGPHNLHDTFKRMREGLPVCLALTHSFCSPPPAQMKGLLLKLLHTRSDDATFSSVFLSASDGHHLMRLWRGRSCTPVSKRA